MFGDNCFLIDFVYFYKTKENEGENNFDLVKFETARILLVCLTKQKLHYVEF